MKFWVKSNDIKQETHTEHVVAVCDENLLGKTFGNTKISESFYKGTLMSREDMISELKKATVGNVFGDNAIEAALEEKIVANAGIIEIAGIKHAQIFRM